MASKKSATPTKKTPAKKAAPKRMTGGAASKDVSQDVSAPSALPGWVVRKVDADGFLPVPGALSLEISKALGPLARKYAMGPATGLRAGRSRTGRWGLHRMFSVGDGAGPEIARVITTWAAYDLPLTALHFWYPVHGEAGSVAGATDILHASLAGPAVGLVESLEVHLVRVPFEQPIVRTLVQAVTRMPLLSELRLQPGSSGVVDVVRACPALHTLQLTGLTASDLGSLTSLPAVARLESLGLTWLDAGDREVDALFTAAWAQGLRSLELTRKRLEPADYRGVAQLGLLQELKLRFVDEASLMAIADAPFMPNLRKLELIDCRLDARLCRRMAARGLPLLERLHVKQCEMSDAALKVLVDAAPGLKELGIPRTSLPKTWSKRGRTIS